MNEIIQGDCLEVMKTFPDNHFSAVVCDPPYMIGFMNKEFDKFKDNPASSIDLWKEAMRISKPGAHLLAFGGDRTHHHLMLAIEQAGWEIKTCLYWLTGQGFPKSHNISKALDKENGSYIPGEPSPNSRESGQSPSGCCGVGVQSKRLDNPQCELAKTFEGYGTALKPAAEIIVIAMKPLDGTFAQNAEKWGLAGINIDACRIGTTVETWPSTRSGGIWTQGETIEAKNHNKGRWPANVIFDEESSQGLGDKARYFYCPKTSSRERNEGLEGTKNVHPTIKPLALMRYLITLVAPPTNALILDPFAGSGSTILAAKQLGISAIGIEKQPEYAEIARARLNAAEIFGLDDKQMEPFA